MWNFATAGLVLAPCGYYISAKLIVDGDVTFKKIETMLLLLFGIGGSIATIIMYTTLSSSQNTEVWDSLIVLILLFCSYEFYKVYNVVPELRRKISFLLFGLVLAIISLSLNLIIVFVTKESNLLRTVIPLIGQVFVVLAFTSIPDSMRRSKAKSIS